MTILPRPHARRDAQCATYFRRLSLDYIFPAPFIFPPSFLTSYSVDEHVELVSFVRFPLDDVGVVFSLCPCKIRKKLCLQLQKPVDELYLFLHTHESAQRLLRHRMQLAVGPARLLARS